MQTSSEIANEVFKRVDQLAQALGTTAEHLYETLARKGLGLGIISAVVLLAFLITLRHMFKSWKNAKIEQRRLTDAGNRYDEIFTVQSFPAALISSILSGILLIASLVMLENLPYLIAPEAYATERVVEILK